MSDMYTDELNLLCHQDIDGTILIDENHKPIPRWICICFAHSSSECVCGAWDMDIKDIDEKTIQQVDEFIENYDNG